MIPDEIERVMLLGWAVHPVSRTSKAACFEGAAAASTCDLFVVEEWCRKYPGCNWRMACGPSRLFALDIDRPGPTHAANGFATMAALVAEHGELPPRPMTRTGGSGGAAMFFRHQGEPLIGRSGHPAPGIDPHRNGQSVMIPPSRHPVTGGAYTWRISPTEMAPPPIPVWLAALLRPPPPPPPVPYYAITEGRAATAVQSAISAVQNAPAGQANDLLNRQAFRLGVWVARRVLHASDAEAGLLAAASARNIPMREAIATIRSGLRAGQQVQP